MATGDHDWTAGEQVTAANMDDYLQLQVVGQYADASTRNTALSARKREGMVSYQLDVNSLTVYTGSGTTWSTIGPVHGAPTTMALTITQSGSVTCTQLGGYIRVGRWIIGQAYLAPNSSGTGSNDIVIGGLPVAAFSGNITVGGGSITDATAGGANYWGPLYMPTTTTMKIRGDSNTATFLGNSGSGFTAALASGDEIWLDFKYIAAADA